MTTPQPVIELVDFALLELHMILGEGPSEESGPNTPKIDFNMIEEDPKALLYRLILHVGFESVGHEEGQGGLRVKAVIGGQFRCPEEMPSDKRLFPLLFNGGLILYGLLRGQLSAIGGAFPAGKLMLPSVNMLEVVRHWTENQRTTGDVPKQPTSIDTAPTQAPARRRKPNSPAT